MIFLTIYGLGFLLVLLASVYMDVDHYKAYKNLPENPHLLMGFIIGFFWPFMFMLCVTILIVSWFGILYKNLIKLLVK